MQFTYRVTEAEYQTAWKLRSRAKSSLKTLRIVLFWVFVLVCLTMLWALVQKHASKTSSEPSPAVTQSDQNVQAPAQTHERTARSLASNVVPFLLILAFWIFLRFQIGPRNIRRLYRNDPAMQGEYTVEVTPAILRIENTSGVTARNGWNLYDAWSEDRDIILLLKSGAYFILSLRQLSEQQRNELRGILSSALPGK